MVLAGDTAARLARAGVTHLSVCTSSALSQRQPCSRGHGSLTDLTGVGWVVVSVVPQHGIDRAVRRSDSACRACSGGTSATRRTRASRTCRAPVARGSGLIRRDAASSNLARRCAAISSLIRRSAAAPTCVRCRGDAARSSGPASCAAPVVFIVCGDGRQGATRYCHGAETNPQKAQSNSFHCFDPRAKKKSIWLKTRDAVR